MATPQQKPAGSGPIDQKDVAGWSERFGNFMAKPGETINSKSPEGAQPWHHAVWSFYDPIDTCLISWCLPCVTFGKTHHRVHKNGNLEGYEPVNTSCLLLVGSACVGLSIIPLVMQRAEVRHKYNLEGSCLTDIALTCCCGLCSIIQQDKEAEYREALLGGSGVVTQQLQGQEGMVYPGQ